MTSGIGRAWFGRLATAALVMQSAILTAPAFAQGHGQAPPQAQARSQESPYKPYEALIGEWATGPEGGPTAFYQQISWGPNKSYIKFAVSTMETGKEEPHLEGVVMYNGRNKNLDMLFMVDLKGGRAQEQGTFSVEPDGTIVRDHILISDAGTATFRQTWKVLGPNRIATAVLRKTATGWEANFPGADNFVMTPRVRSAN